MIIERKFVNTGKEKPLSSKKAVAAMHEAAKATFELDIVFTCVYIGNGVYTLIMGKKGF